MFCGSSGATAPIGDQFFVKALEIDVALGSVGGMTPKRRAMLLASWGYRVVLVALSLKAPYFVSNVCLVIAVLRSVARFNHVSFKPVVSLSQVASEALVSRVR